MFVEHKEAGELQPTRENSEATYCPHGYDECWRGCVYPGRCGRFEGLDEASKLLLKAADLIEDHGFVQNRIGRGEGDGFCVAHAMARAFGGDDLYESHAYKRLRRSLGMGPYESHAYKRLHRSLGMGPSIWNDEPGRTKEEVVAKLRAVALGG
jgi:hypothetical protein